MRRWAKFLRDESGASALEFAIIAIPAVFFTFGLIEFARVLFLQQNLAFAADHAARLLYLDPTVSTATVQTAVRAEIMAANPADLTVQVPATSQVGALQERRIVLQYHFDFLIPALLPDGIDLSASRSVLTGVVNP